MNPLLLFSAVLTLAGQAPPLQAPPAPQEAPVTLGDVVVDGVAPRDRARGYVDEILITPHGQGPARWNRRLCVGTVNLQPEVARYVIDRVSAVAQEVGLEPGLPGCRAEVLIFGASDGPELARALVEGRPRTFRVGGSGMDLGWSALQRFQTSDAPVRWWHVSLPMTELGEAAVTLPGEGTPVIRTDMSRLRTRIINELKYVIIIIDVGRAEGVSLQPLSDYVAMVALAQIDAGADMGGHSSVLNLFADPAAPTELTEWDLGYLHALYESDLDAASTTAQAREVARRLTDTARTEED
ncbi:MAG: hypothetical protein ACK4VY_09145 [Brevundimonas sp.]